MPRSLVREFLARRKRRTGFVGRKLHRDMQTRDALERECKRWWNDAYIIRQGDDFDLKSLAEMEIVQKTLESQFKHWLYWIGLQIDPGKDPEAHTRDLDELLHQHQNCTTDCSINPMQALYGLYLDLLVFLKPGDVQTSIRYYKLLSHVPHSTEFGLYVHDIFAVMHVFHSSESELENLTEDVAKIVHRHYEHQFSPEKVNVLRALLYRRQLESKKEKLHLTRVSPERLPYCPGALFGSNNDRARLRLRWKVTNPLVYKGSTCRFTLEGDADSPVGFCSDDQVKATVDVQVEGEYIEADIAPIPHQTARDVTIVGCVVNDALGSSTTPTEPNQFAIKLFHTEPFDGQLKSDAYSGDHYILAQDILEHKDYHNKRFIVGMKIDTGPASALVAAIQDVARHQSRSVVIFQNENEVKEYNGQGKPADVYIVCADETKPESINKTLPGPSNEHQPLVVVWSDRGAGLRHEDVSEWHSLWTPKPPRLSLVVIEAVGVEDAFDQCLARLRSEAKFVENIKEQQSKWFKDTHDWTKIREKLRNDCETLIDKSLPDVIFDAQARLALRRWLMHYLRWDTRYNTILRGLAGVLKGQTPYITLDTIADVKDKVEPHLRLSVKNRHHPHPTIKHIIAGIEGVIDRDSDDVLQALLKLNTPSDRRVSRTTLLDKMSDEWMAKADVESGNSSDGGQITDYHSRLSDALDRLEKQKLIIWRDELGCEIAENLRDMIGDWEGDQLEQD